MKLITVDENDMPVFNPEARMVKEFKVIIERDKGSVGDADGRKKRLATKELAFVHFIAHYNSEFVTSYPEDERVQAIVKHLDMPDKWKPDAVIQLACITYKELINTPSQDLLIEMREALFSAEKFVKILRRKFEAAMQDLDMEVTGDDKEENDKKSLDKVRKLYDDITSIAKKSPEVMETVAKLEERVKKEMEIESKGRKQQIVNKFEM